MRKTENAYTKERNWTPIVHHSKINLKLVKNLNVMPEKKKQLRKHREKAP